MTCEGGNTLKHLKRERRKAKNKIEDYFRTKTCNKEVRHWSLLCRGFDERLQREWRQLSKLNTKICLQGKCF